MAEFKRPNPEAPADPRHLAALLKVESVDIDKEKVIVHGTPPADAQAIIDAYAYDPTWGKDPQDVEMTKLRTKALDVWQGNSTFTAAQMQKIVAGIVLRLTK